MIFPESKIFVTRVSNLIPFHLAFFHYRYGWYFPHDSHFPKGHICFQPMVCCEGFWFHTHDQQALGWENFFSLAWFDPYLALSFPWETLEFP
jgi:hypothetical protein